MQTKLKKTAIWIKSNKFLLVFFIIYLIVSFAIIFFHENWEDEAQAWLTARDCSPIEIIQRMKYEGHFLPWYFIIMPFAKLGLPFKTINFISWAISGVSSWLMLKYLPCKRFKRIILIFTLPMLYLYPIIARCYCLIPLATILLIIYYKNRFQRPLPYLISIVLMANTHIYCFAFAAMLGFEFLIDWLKEKSRFSERQNHKIFICILSTTLIAVLTCIPLIGSASEASASDIANNDISINLKHLVIGDTISTIRMMYSFAPEMIIYGFTAIVISYLILYKWDTFLKISFSVLWQYLIFDCIFTILLPQRAFIPMFFLLFFVARTVTDRHNKTLRMAPKIIIAIILVLLVIATGSLFCGIMAFVFIIMAFIPYYIKKRTKHSFCTNKVMWRLCSFAMTILALLSINESWNYIHHDITHYYSGAYPTAHFIKSKLLSDNTQPVFLTDTRDFIALTPIIAYLDDRDFKIYSSYYDQPLTYDLLSRDYDVKRKNIQDYCHIINEKQRCYYITNYDYYNEVLYDISLNGKNSMDADVENEKIFRKIYDSGALINNWRQATAENYRIYEITE